MLIKRHTFVALVFMTITALFSTATMAAGNSSRATPMKFVGVFYASYAEGGRIVTYHSDGTASLVDANMFSTETIVAPGRRQTPFSGVWRKVSKDTIQVTTLHFTTEIGTKEMGGFEYNPDGFIIKTKWLATFDKPVKGVSPGYTATHVESEAFFSYEDPLTSEPIAIIPGVDGRGERLNVE